MPWPVEWRDKWRWTVENFDRLYGHAEQRYWTLDASSSSIWSWSSSLSPSSSSSLTPFALPFDGMASAIDKAGWLGVAVERDFIERSKGTSSSSLLFNGEVLKRRRETIFDGFGNCLNYNDLLDDETNFRAPFLTSSFSQVGGEL